MAALRHQIGVDLFRGLPPRFDVSVIRNRRFMWAPRSGELILGRGDVAFGSHASEHLEARVATRFESFVRGWVGFGGAYRAGVLHFAPGFREDMTAEHCDEVCSTIAVFVLNGAGGELVLRHAGQPRPEVRLADAFPEVLLYPHRFLTTTRSPVRTDLTHLGAMGV